MRKRSKRTLKETVDRIVARHSILVVANAGLPNGVKPHSMHRLNEAVFKCRQRALVSADVLTTAGFRTKRRSN